MTLHTDSTEPTAQIQRSPLLLSLQDAGHLLGVSKWTMYELMHTGILPSVKIQSRRFIAKGDLDQYVQQLRVEAGERHGL